MLIQGQITVKDYVSAQRLHRTRPITANLFFVGVFAFTLLIAFFGVISIFIDSPTYSLFIPFALGASIYFLNHYVWFPNRFKKRFLQDDDLKIPFQIEISETEITHTTASKRITNLWAMFIQWKENRDVLLLYSSEETFLTIPKRHFTAEQVAAIKEYLKVKKIPFRKATNIPLEGCAIYIVIGIVVVIFLLIVFNNTNP